MFKLISTDLESSGGLDEYQDKEQEIEVEVLDSEDEDSDKPIKNKKQEK